MRPKAGARGHDPEKSLAAKAHDIPVGVFLVIDKTLPAQAVEKLADALEADNFGMKFHDQPIDARQFRLLEQVGLAALDVGVFEVPATKGKLSLEEVCKGLKVDVKARRLIQR